ncbi:alpha/beta hydrolase [Roseomonas populi]|uniref:Acyl-CoA:diacylglycerol acyltransferase n=1 Tax=Roseomonas populi TaxID=3121582 RepID=A0ABT1WYH7_9PROT|nr:alpha/beta hydrolase-fold protein [Roseomonas pecuniae]MCR0980900.1 alpha/beta hydrolase-fold protein [Roseomonas pecuniae]
MHPMTEKGLARRRLVSLAAGAPLALAAGGARATAAGRVEERQFARSAVLGKDVRYSVYLPPDYDSSKRAYPLIYMLHGGESGTDTDWFRFGRLNVLLDRLIGSGRFPAAIVVSPNGQRDEANRNNTYYMNDADGAFRWEDMFFADFMPQIEERYRVIGGREGRAIAGLSMGGYGALAYSMRHPRTFIGAAALSAAFRTDQQIVTMDQPGYDRRYGKAWGLGLQGEARLNNLYRDYSVLDMVDRLPPENVKGTPFYIDCGAEDRFFDGNAILHQKLRDMGVAHSFMIRPGLHNWDYWRSGSEGALLFLGKMFQQ